MRAENKKRIIRIIIVALLVPVFVVLAVSNRASADEKTIMQKALIEGVKKCYSSGKVIDGGGINFNDSINFSDYVVNGFGGKEWDFIPLPSGYTKIDDNAVSCHQLFIGYKGLNQSFDGVLNTYGKQYTFQQGESEAAQKREFLTGMGFESDGKPNGTCFRAQFQSQTKSTGNSYKDSGEKFKSAYICVEEDSSASAIKMSVVLPQDTTGVPLQSLTMVASSDGKKLTVGGNWVNEGKLAEEDKMIDIEAPKDVKSFDDVMNRIDAIFKNELNYITNIDSTNGMNSESFVLKYKSIVDKKDKAEVSEYGSDEKFTLKDTTGSKAANYIFGTDKSGFTKEEQKEYLMGTITKYFFAGQNVSDYWICDIKDMDKYSLSNYKKIYIDQSGAKTATESCVIDITNSKTDTANVFTGNKGSVDERFFSNAQGDIEYVIDFLNGLVGKPNGETTDDENNIAGPVDTDDDSNTYDDLSDDEICFNNAGALGWVICPVIKSLTSLTESLYAFAEENFLQLKTDYLGEKTEEVWGHIQDFANIIFVIILLVVIFSQLTGYGIDNYGIKKVLPRLIIAALLINISFIICKLAVDFANIIGSSIGGMVNDLVPVIDKAEVHKTIEPGWAVPIVGGIGVGIAALVENPAIALTFLMALLSAVLSLFFLLLIMVARQMAIIVLAIVSPLAFVAFLLPNTSSFLKKWWDSFKMLLLVYPICALLAGVGRLLSNLAISASESGLMTIIALLVRVLPFFAIPTMLRRSMDAFGSLGTAISNIGNRAGQGITNGIKSSDEYKALQQRGLEHKNQLKAGVDKNGKFTRIGSVKNRIAQSRPGQLFGLHKLQAARVQQAGKNREANISAAAELAGAQRRTDVANGDFEGNEKYFSKKLEEALDKGNIDQIFAVLDQAKSSGMKGGKIAQMTRDVFGQEDSFNGWSAGDRQNFLQDFSNRYGDSFLKKDYEQMMWAANGGKGSVTEGGDSVAMALEKRDADGNLTASYAEHNISNSDLEDDNISSLSSARLSELIAAGKISQPAAQRVWSSNGSMDDANRLILGAFANNGTVLTKSDAEHNLANDGKATVKLDPETVRELTKAAARDVQVVNSVIPTATNPSGDNNGGTTPTNNQNNGGPIPKPTPRKGGDNNNNNNKDGGGSDHDTQSGTQNNGGKDDSDKWGHGYNDNDRDDGLM